jgi:hypothetical protein
MEEMMRMGEVMGSFQLFVFSAIAITPQLNIDWVPGLAPTLGTYANFGY